MRMRLTWLLLEQSMKWVPVLTVTISSYLVGFCILFGFCLSVFSSSIVWQL